jgi:Leucine-rich repeat (LRR) protein
MIINNFNGFEKWLYHFANEDSNKIRPTASSEEPFIIKQKFLQGTYKDTFSKALKNFIVAVNHLCESDIDRESSKNIVRVIVHLKNNLSEKNGKLNTLVQSNPILLEELLKYELKVWKDDPLIQGEKKTAAKAIMKAFKKDSETLDLSGLGLTELPQCIGRLSNLEILHAHNNRLTSLPESIGQLTRLREIGLIMNSLNTLPHSIVQLKHLEVLKIGENCFKYIPESIGKLENINHLELNMNYLRELPDFITKRKPA